MNNEEKGNSLEPEDIPSTGIAPKQETAELPDAGPEDTTTAAPIAADTPQAVAAAEQSVDADGPPSLSVVQEPQTGEAASSVVEKSVSVAKPQSFFEEQPLPVIEMAPRVLRYRTRRDLLLFSTGAVAAVAGAGFLLPQTTLSRLGVRRNINARGKEWLLNKVVRIDDDVAEALYSRHRMVFWFEIR